MNNTAPRTYKTISRQKLAIAYGLQKTETIMKRIKSSLHRLNDEQLIQLGAFEGYSRLFPDQVEIIVTLLGKPENPTMLYE